MILTQAVRVVRSAAKSHPCPRCGKPGRRKRHLHRRIRSLAYRQEAYLDVHHAEYQSRCGCRNYFRSGRWMSLPSPTTTPQVRQAVLDRIADWLKRYHRGRPARPQHQRQPSPS